MKSHEVKDVFGGVVRVRVMGILVVNDSILMIKHKGLNDDNELWVPPGGGVKPGESLHEALIREFKEETHLDIMPGKFLFTNEFISDPLHAIELFFEIKSYSGKTSLGSDPEMVKDQILAEVKFMTFADMTALPNDKIHGALQNVQSPQDLQEKQGHFYFHTH